VQEQQLQILHECQNFLQIKNPTKRTFWWNQPIADTRQLTQTNIEEIDRWAIGTKVRNVSFIKMNPLLTTSYPR
jgi:hypothetical protein